MKKKTVLIAPDSFKDSLSAIDVAQAVKAGFKKFFPHWEYIIIPVSDGGEGFLQTSVDCIGGKVISKKVLDPLGREVMAKYAMLDSGETAIIEMATASGIEILKKEERNPKKTSSFGTGQLVLDAINNGTKTIILGLGGSATNDGGMGLISALGFKLLDENGNKLEAIGENLIRVRKIDSSNVGKNILNTKFIVASDVDTFLCGENGATKIFAPQKGASWEDVIYLENGMESYGYILENVSGKSIFNIKGMGAAGGLAASVYAFFETKMKSGFEIINDFTNLEDNIKKADFVVTGEGEINNQTHLGKAPSCVANLAKKYNKKTIAITGSINENYYENKNNLFYAVFSIVPGVVSLESAIVEGKKNIISLCKNIAKVMDM